MAVTVRLFAAVREAAGTGEVAVDAPTLAALLDDLRGRFGATFAERLALCTVLVDGAATARDADVALAEGAEVVLLPPVSGGSAGIGRGTDRRGASGSRACRP
jgi:sulfur-carrier protein